MPRSSEVSENQISNQLIKAEENSMWYAICMPWVVVVAAILHSSFILVDIFIQISLAGLPATSDLFNERNFGAQNKLGNIKEANEIVGVSTIN